MRPFFLLIICAVVVVVALLSGLPPSQADELESAVSDPLEPGNLEFSSQTQPEVPEPGQITMTVGNHSSPRITVHLGPDHSSGPPEPSTKPIFSGPDSNQGPPEPSTRPHFSGGGTSQQQPNPPEPSTRPHFTGGSSTSQLQPLNPPEPSTRPHFVQVTSRPRIRRPLTSSYYSEGPRTKAPPRAPYQENEDQYHHLYDHPSLVIQRLNQPYTQSVWRCDIQRNSCFLRSKHNFVPFRPQYNFEGTPIALVLDIGAAARKRHSLTRRPNPVYSYAASRLESTSYFLAQYADACISFSYLWSGVGKKHMHILQRSQEDVCIYSAAYDPEDPNYRANNGLWQDIQLQLDLRYGAAKFWIEYQFDIGQKREYYESYADLGFIAIRNFTIGYGECQNSKTEECDVPSSR